MQKKNQDKKKKKKKTDHSGTRCANSQRKVVGLTARPAGQRSSRGYPPTHCQYSIQLPFNRTGPFGTFLQIAKHNK